jgi:hypothetical protein
LKFKEYEAMKLSLLPAVFAICLIAVATSKGDEETIKPEQLPKAVKASLDGRFPGAEITSAVKETENGQVVFDIELKQKGHKFESDIKEDGTILEIEKEVATKDWPKALAAAVAAKYPKSTIKEVMEVNLVKDKKETPDHLEVTLETSDKKEEEVIASLDGKKITEEPAAPEEAKKEPAKK